MCSIMHRVAVLAVCAAGVVADVGKCVIAPGTRNVSIVGTTLQFMGDYMCPKLQQLKADYPDIDLRDYNKQDVLLQISTFDRIVKLDIELVQHEAFVLGNTLYDVYSVGGAWWKLSAEYFTPLKPSATAHVRPIFEKKNEAGDTIGVPHSGSRLVMYYRRDLLEKHGLTWPKTMAEFDVTVKAVMDAERAAGNPDFWGFLAPTSDTSNALMSLLTTLLSTEDGGGIVEPDGSVTINNPGAAVVLTRWRAWFGTILPPNSFFMRSSEARDMFDDGNAFVILGWTSKMDKYEVIASKRGFDVAMGSVPGKNGAGTVGGQSSFVPQSAPSQEVAKKYLESFAGSLHEWTVQKKNTEPLVTKTIEDPFLFAEYCSNVKHRLLCESLKAFPDFWTRAVYRPDAGCRALFTDCMEKVYTNLRPFFESSTPATETLKDLEKDLLELLGHVRPETSDMYSDAKWKYMLVAVACVSGLVLALLGGFVWRQNKRMRKADGCGIPISVCLGFVVLVFIGSLGGVLVEKSDSALREVSLDMSLEVRMQALSVMSTTLELRVQGMDRPDLSSIGVVQAALVEVKNSFARQRVLEGSLIVVVDAADGRVLVSSDSKRQPEQAIYPLVHQWVSEALTQLEFQTKLIDSTRMLRVKDDEGTVALCNQRSVSVGAWGRRDGLRGNWILMYITPEHVILGKATATREATLYIGVSLALAAIVCVVFCAVVVTNPLVHLAEDMEHVRTMNLERVSDTKRSLFTELGSLRAGFDSMRELLVYYKAFMPQSVLVEHSSSTDSMLTFVSSHMPTKASSNSSTSRAVAVACMGLKRRRVGVLLTNLRNFTNSCDDDIHVVHTAYLDLLLLKARLHRGVVDSVSGDKVTISFNAASRTPVFEKCTMEMALSLLSSADFEGNIAASCGTVRCGNMGTHIMKRFDLVGHVIRMVWRMERWGSLWKVPIVVDGELRDTTLYVAETRKLMRMADGGKTITLYDVTGAKQQDGTDEWMYQLEEMDKTNPHRATNDAFDALYDADIASATALFRKLARPGQLHLQGLLDQAKEGGCLKPCNFMGLHERDPTRIRQMPSPKGCPRDNTVFTEVVRA